MSLSTKRPHTRFFFNWSFLTLSQIVVAGTGFFANIRVARALEPEGFGHFGFLLGLVSMFSIIATFGMRDVIVREVSRKPSLTTSILEQILPLRIILTFLAGTMMLIFIKITSGHIRIVETVSILLLLVFLSLSDFFESLSFGRQEMSNPAIASSLSAIFWALAVIITPMHYLGLETVLILYVIAQTPRMLILFLLESKSGYFRSKIKTHINKLALLYSSIPFLWINGVTSIVNVAPVLLLGLYSNNKEIGIYNAGYKLTAPLLIINATALSSLFPRLSNLFITNRDNYNSEIRFVLRLLFIIGTLIAFFLSIFSKEIILFVYGRGYFNANYTFPYQAWTTTLFSIFSLIGIMLASSDKQKISAILATISSIIFAPFIFIGAHLGALGIVKAIFFVSLFNMIYHVIILYKTINLKIMNIDILCAVLIFSGFGIVYYFINELSLTFRIIVFCIVTSLLLFLIYKFKFSICFVKRGSQ